jgi:hypothetical protein
VIKAHGPTTEVSNLFRYRHAFSALTGLTIQEISKNGGGVNFKLRPRGKDTPRPYGPLVDIILFETARLKIRSADANSWALGKEGCA